MIRKLILIFVFVLSLHSFAEAGKKGWKEDKGRFFIVFYKNAPKDFVENVQNAADDYYSSIAKEFGYRRLQTWSYDERAKIYVYDSADDYVNEGKNAGWSHGVASPKQKIIRTFPSAHGFFDSTLPHELAHIIFREYIGFTAQIPSWFEEGVAMYNERARRYGADDVVNEAIDNGTFMDLEELTYTRLTRNTPTKKVELFYAESASIVNFLINEQGKTRFTRFCRMLKDGKPFEWALDAVYVRYKNLEELNKAWIRHLKR